MASAGFWIINFAVVEFTPTAIDNLDIKRSDMVMSTKLFWGGAGPNDTGLSKKHIFEGMRASLSRTGLDYLDIFMAHRPDARTPTEEIVRAFSQVVQSGQALYWGTSEWSAHDVERAHHMADLHGLVAPVCDQPQYNAFWRARVEGELRPVLRNYGYGLTVWSPLDNGVMTGKYNDGTLPAGSRLTGEGSASSDRQNMIDFGRALSTPEGQAKIEKVKRLGQVARELGCSTAQLALAWCLCNEQVSTVITGASRPEQVVENSVDEDSLPGAALWTCMRQDLRQALLNRASPRLLRPGRGIRIDDLFHNATTTTTTTTNEPRRVSACQWWADRACHLA